MHNALSLAIGSGFKFDVGDVKHVIENYRSGYWIGASDEWIYGDAVAIENGSAVASYEAWKGREGFLADDVQMYWDSDGYSHGDRLNRQRERLTVGAGFAWKGSTLKVTSFSADQSYVNACSYKKVKREGSEYEREKIDKRFKITRSDLLAERKERKERNELMGRLTAAATDSGESEKIVKALGVKSKSDYARLPIEKIRKVAEKFAPEKAA